MSCNYAESLSHYENKGKLGLPEIFDNEDELEIKCKKLAEFLEISKHTVVHTGAGISTSAGIPDFRGPNGVWTLEKKGEKPSISVSWDDAKPTKTHMALLALQKAGYISYIITQNIDGLHLRSGIPRRYISELHGNLYTDKCGTCQRQYVRQEAAATVGLKSRGVSCPGRKVNGRRCRGKLQDTILDWEDSLPDTDLDMADMHSCSADLSLCLGTTLQIVPSGNLPVHTKKRGGKLVICNLQPTKQDKHADLLLHSYVDEVMTRVLSLLHIPLPEYDAALDPVFITREKLSTLGYPLCSSTQGSSSDPDLPEGFVPLDWTIPEKWTKDKDLIRKAQSRKIVKRKSKSDSIQSQKVKMNKCEAGGGILEAQAKVELEFNAVIKDSETSNAQEDKKELKFEAVMKEKSEIDGESIIGQTVAINKFELEKGQFKKEDIKELKFVAEMNNSGLNGVSNIERKETMNR